MSSDWLRRAMPPVADVELRRDLWPEMLRRMERRKVRVARLDWALAGVVMAWLAMFPETIAGLLYQL